MIVSIGCKSGELSLVESNTRDRWRSLRFCDFEILRCRLDDTPTFIAYEVPSLENIG